MQCPYCSFAETKVIDSRLAADSTQVRRRRECLSCSERFTTYETVELSLPFVVKRDSAREPFNEEKLRSGIMHALEKRPVASEAVDEVISRIKYQCLASGERELSAKQIGDWTMDELYKLDHVAYIRFASVYLSFADINAFRDVIEHLETKRSGTH